MLVSFGSQPYTAKDETKVDYNTLTLAGVCACVSVCECVSKCTWCFVVFVVWQPRANHRPQQLRLLLALLLRLRLGPSSFVLPTVVLPFLRNLRDYFAHTEPASVCVFEGVVGGVGEHGHTATHNDVGLSWTAAGAHCELVGEGGGGGWEVVF